MAAREDSSSQSNSIGFGSVLDVCDMHVLTALLPELAALGDVLARQPQWADDLRAVRARQLRILQVHIALPRWNPYGVPVRRCECRATKSPGIGLHWQPECPCLCVASFMTCDHNCCCDLLSTAHDRARRRHTTAGTRLCKPQQHSPVVVWRTLQLVAARYYSAGNTASAVVLLEAAVREFEDVLGLRHPGIVALSRRAEQLFEALPPEAREKVRAAVSICTGPILFSWLVAGC